MTVVVVVVVVVVVQGLPLPWSRHRHTIIRSSKRIIMIIIIPPPKLTSIGQREEFITTITIRARGRAVLQRWQLL